MERDGLKGPIDSAGQILKREVRPIESKSPDCLSDRPVAYIWIQYAPISISGPQTSVLSKAKAL